MRAGDAWIEKLAMFISRRCDLFRWSAVFRRCRRRCRLPLVHRFPPWRRCLTWTRHEFGYDLRPPSTGKIFVWPPAFLSETRSARYSSAPSITTVWSNYQTSYNDLFEVYITETVTLSPWSFRPIQLFNQYLNKGSCDQTFFVLIGQNRLQLMSVMTIHKYVNV